MDARRLTVLVVDDDKGHRTMLKAVLRGAGYVVREADDGDVAVEIVGREEVDLVLLDLKMARMGGLEALEAIKGIRSTVPVILMTAFSSVETAVVAIKKGAYDYVTKPLDVEDLKLKIERALEAARLRQEDRLLRERIGEQFDFSAILGQSPRHDGDLRDPGLGGALRGHGPHHRRVGYRE